MIENDSKLCVCLAAHVLLSSSCANNHLLSRVKFSNFYLLIGWKIKSYFANSEKFWPFGLYERHKAKKGQKNIFGK